MPSLIAVRSSLIGVIPVTTANDRQSMTSFLISFYSRLAESKAKSARFETRTTSVIRPRVRFGHALFDLVIWHRQKDAQQGNWNKN